MVVYLYHVGVYMIVYFCYVCVYMIVYLYYVCVYMMVYLGMNHFVQGNKVGKLMPFF